MSHDTVFYSRPRTYGKGSRGWYVPKHLKPRFELLLSDLR